MSPEKMFPSPEQLKNQMEVDMLNSEATALEGAGEKRGKRKWAEFFKRGTLALLFWIGSGAALEGKALAETGNKNADSNKSIVTTPYNEKDFLRAMEERDKEIAQEMSPARPYNQEDLIKAIDSRDEERKQQIYQRAIERVKSDLLKTRDYSRIENTYLKNSAERDYKNSRLWMKVMVNNPEKTKIKLIDERTLLISVEYQNVDGETKFHDYFYQIVEKK